MTVAAQVSAEQAVAIALELYGLAARAEPLPGEYDANFRLITPTGATFLLKVMHQDADRAAVELQVALLAHLGERAPGFVAPRVCPARGGALITTTAVGDSGEERLVWLLTYLPGRLFAEANPHGDELLADLGAQLGRLDAALADFSHPAALRPLKWDLARAGWIGEHLDAIAEPERRALVAAVLARYTGEVVPALPGLRRSVIHNDANDYNLLVGPARQWPQRITGIIDYGDALLTATVCEVAIAAAYAILGKTDPLGAAAQLVRGYHGAYPLRDQELAVLFPLIAMRLAVSVVNSALRKLETPDDPYLTVSEAPAWVALEALASIHPRFAHYALRAACGLPPVPAAEPVTAWLQANQGRFAPILGRKLPATAIAPLDLSVGSLALGADPRAVERPALQATIDRLIGEAGATVGAGGYGEARMLYAAPAFGEGHPTDERRTIHLGLDLWLAAGSLVFAPLDGVVHCVADNATRLDYGPLVILAHRTPEGHDFYTLYGHLDGWALANLRPGQTIARGERIGAIGASPGNGDWPPHLHVQIIVDPLELDRDYPGVALASQRELWLANSPDPNLLLNLPPERLPAAPPTPAETLATRRARIGRNLSIAYRRPLKIVRGWMQYLYDETGRAYLDVYNNVPHVGHSHPRVVAAAQAQLGLLNTNTRYLHDTILRYAEGLTALLPAPLAVCYFVNSASEANELALRLARAFTGQRDMIVLDAAYHGHTTGLIDISPYKFAGPGGTGAPDWVHVAPIPDDYRGSFRRDDPAAGPKYAAQVAGLVAALKARGRGLAGYIAESLPSVGGQIVLPRGYLPAVYDAVRAAGGLCIADEVQVGFGRLGESFWGFELQGVVPDIVVLGKPIGNGFPLGAVITTRAIADAFDNGMEFFSTFGGNPVACAAGLAVLEVIRDEGLQERARRVGGELIAGLRGLAENHAVLGDVRGAGLFLGLELVRDRATLEPADAEASYVVNRLRERGILAGTDGPYHNVIKLRPPMPFDAADAALLIARLDAILGEDAARA